MTYTHIFSHYKEDIYEKSIECSNGGSNGSVYGRMRFVQQTGTRPRRRRPRPRGGDDGAETKEAASTGEVTTIEFFQMKDEEPIITRADHKEFEAQNPDIKIRVHQRSGYGDRPDDENGFRPGSGRIYPFPLDASFREQVKAGYMMDLTGEKMLDNVADDILDISLIDSKSYSIRYP